LLTNDKPWSDAIAYCDTRDKTFDVFAEVKTKFINPNAVGRFRSNKMYNMDIHGGVYDKFRDAISEETPDSHGRVVNDGTFLHVFYYTLDMSDPECKTINVLKTVQTKTMAYYNHDERYYGRTSQDDVVVRPDRTSRSSLIKVNYPKFHDVTATRDRTIVLDAATIASAAAQYAADVARSAAIYGVRSAAPSAGPSSVPSAGPSSVPSAGPSAAPSAGPSSAPSAPSAPSAGPSAAP
jgi:hypothetical protein